MTEYNQVLFKMISSSKESWYLRYPGFCNLKIVNGKETEPFFTSGIGHVLKTKCNEFNVGDYVLFTGFANAECEEYITTKNSLVKICSDKSDITKLGVATQMVYAATMLNPQAGMHFYVDPSIKDTELLMKVISGIGCTAEIEADPSRWYDGAIVINECKHDIKLTDSANVVFLTESGLKVCNTIGQDFNNEMYMIRGNEVPRHYLTATTSKNMETAYRICCASRDALEVKNEPEKSLSESCFAERMRKAFVNHINPASISIAVRNPDEELARSIAKALAFYITQEKVDMSQSYNVGQSFLDKVLFTDGTIADCMAIKSKAESFDVEIHFDRTSLVYKDKKYQEYKGLKVSFEKELSEASLTLDDIATLTKGAIK